MTLEQANEAALKAASAGDMDALEYALRARAEAIRNLVPLEPEGLRRAIAAGESIHRELRAFKNRAANLRSALATSLESHIDFLG